MDQAIEVNSEIEILQSTSGWNPAEVTEVMDSNSSNNNAVPEKQEKNMNAKIENGKQITENAVAKRQKTLKRKATDAPSSEMAIGSAKASKNLKNSSGNIKSKDEKFEVKKRKVISDSGNKSIKNKMAHPPTAEMAIESIKSLRKRNGATLQDIGKQMEEMYGVSMKYLKQHVSKFLQKSVDNGQLEKIEGNDSDGRYKIKKSENLKKQVKNSSLVEKKMTKTKKQVK